MYAAGNPVTFCDPSGHFWAALIGAIVGAVLGAIFGGTNGMPFLAENWKNFNLRGAIFGFLNGALSGFLLGAMDLAFMQAVPQLAHGTLAGVPKEILGKVMAYGGAIAGLFAPDHELSFYLQLAFSAVAYPVFAFGEKLWMSVINASPVYSSALKMCQAAKLGACELLASQVSAAHLYMGLTVGYTMMWVGKGLMYTKLGIGIAIGLVNYLDAGSEDEEAPINLVNFVSASPKPADATP
jgi:hypothetical protein